MSKKNVFKSDYDVSLKSTVEGCIVYSGPAGIGDLGCKDIKDPVCYSLMRNFKNVMYRYLDSYARTKEVDEVKLADVCYQIDYVSVSRSFYKRYLRTLQDKHTLMEGLLDCCSDKDKYVPVLEGIRDMLYACNVINSTLDRKI